MNKIKVELTEDQARFMRQAVWEYIRANENENGYNPEREFGIRIMGIITKSLHNNWLKQQAKN